MSSNENNKIINYTDLTYQDITKQVDNLYKSDDRFKNYNDGELSVMVNELLAGITDMLNYNIERASEEVYIDTAKRYRSAVKLSKNLNYDITRPIPAKAKLKFIINRKTIGTKKVVSIPQFTSLTYNGLNYVTAKSVSITVNPNDSFVESDEIEIYQGEFKTIRYPGLKNGQLNRQYQRYYIDDPTFCDFYGEKDYKYGDFTIVGIGENSSEALDQASTNTYDIRRTSLLAADKIDEYTFNSDKIHPRFKICLLRTSAESEDGEGVELRFGDGTFIDNGLKNSGQSIFVRYFSTLGSKANQLGVVGNIPAINNSNKISFDGINKSDLKAELTSNIITGGDLESIDSIEANAPGVFQTFDRLITKLDYTSYLKSLTSPFDIQNAMAWGEQEELENLNFHQPETVNYANTKPAIKKLFNVILFSAIGKLYTQNVDTGFHEPNLDYRSIVIDDDLTTFRYPSQNYINVIGADQVVGQLYFQQQQFSAQFTAVDFVGDINNETIFYKGYPNFYSDAMPILVSKPWERYTTSVEQSLLGLGTTESVSANSWKDIPLEFSITATDGTGALDDIELLSNRTLYRNISDTVGTVGDWYGSYTQRKPYVESTDTNSDLGLCLHPDDMTGNSRLEREADITTGLLGKILNTSNDFSAPYYTAWGDVAANLEATINRTLQNSEYARQAGLSVSVSANIEQDVKYISNLREKIRNYYNNGSSYSFTDIQNDRLGINYMGYVQFGITLNANNSSYDEFTVSINTFYDEVEKSLCLDHTNFQTASTIYDNTCVNDQKIDKNAYYYGTVTDYGYDLVQKDEVKNDLYNFSGKSSYLVYKNDDYSNELSFIENMSKVITSLDDKAQITCRHIYISPIIQTFKIVGNLNISSGVNGDDVLARLKDSFYQWSNNKIDFSINVYKSNILKVINSFNEITAANITIEPHSIVSKPYGRQYYFDNVSFANGTHYVYSNMSGYSDVGDAVDNFQEIVYYNIDSYLKKYRLNDPDFDIDVKYVSNPTSVGYQPGWPKCQNNQCYDNGNTNGSCFPACDNNDCSQTWSCAALDDNYNGSVPTPPDPLYDPRFDSTTPVYDPSLYDANYSVVSESNEIYSDVLWSSNNPTYQGQAYYTEDKVWYWSNEINERTFLYELVNGIVKDCNGKGRVGIGPIFTTDGSNNKRYNIIEMPEFYAFINELHLDFDEIIKSNIINSDGDIAPLYENVANTYGIKYKRQSSGGFSLKNEIPQFTFNVDYTYV